MSSLLARATSQQQMGYVPHTSVSGDAWQKQRYGTTSGAGAAGGTTLVDTDLGGSDDDYNGRYWIEIRSGTAKGEMKRVVDYTASSGTATLENNGFASQIGSGVEYILWLSPEPVVVIDSSSGETDAVDAVRAEANDFWNGYYLVPITGSHRGKIAQITDFVSSTGTFTLAASFGSALAAGDVCLIRKFVGGEGGVPALTRAFHPRGSNRVNNSMGDGVVGAKNVASLGFSTQIRPSGTLAGSGSVATKSTISGLFQAAGMVEAQDTSVTVGAGSTTAAIKIATGSWENLTIGAMVIYDGNATFIDSLEDGGGGVDTVNVTPTLPSAPIASEVLYATCMYRKSLDFDLYGVCIEWEFDGVRHTMTGCKGSVSKQDGEIPVLAWEFQVDQWAREIEAAPYNAVSAYASSAPVLSESRIAYLGSTKYNINGFSAVVGAQVAAKNVQGNIGANGRCGFQHTVYNSGFSYRELLDSVGTLPQELRFTARTSSKLAVVLGSQSETFAVRVPDARHVEDVPVGDSGGMLDVPDVFGAHDAGTATDGDGTAQKIPDFAFYLS